MKLIYEKSVKGRKGIKLPELNVDEFALPKSCYLRSSPANLPEVSEPEIVQHFTDLAKMNYSPDCNFYPLGSCTMKYNPRILEVVAEIDGFKELHPFSPLSASQGALEVIYNLQKILSEITGMKMTTLSPLAGAQGEFLGMLMVKEYHKSRDTKKKYILVPDTSHGTNTASVKMAGYEVMTVPTDTSGEMDIKIFKDKINNEVAAVIMTCPNTLGIFNSNIREVCRLAHKADALTYCDGANMNAILGRVRPGDIGFDIIHVNLHKTFGAPHGGGGPGSGPVGVQEKLIPFLPQGTVIKEGDKFKTIKKNPLSVGRLSPFYGNFSVIVKAYAYILLLGADGLFDVSSKSVLNANYILERLKDYYELPYKRTPLHECVFSASRQLKDGVTALDIAKYLIDRGFHPPTIYFPLIVKEALMIEPTETASRQTLDAFIEAMIDAAKLAKSNPQILKDAPVNMVVHRLDETRAARQLNINFKPKPDFDRER